MIFILFAGWIIQALGCRYTVREIGYSTLLQDIYMLVLLDPVADPSDPGWQIIRNTLKYSNIRFEVINTEREANHPVVQQALAAGIRFPAKIMLAPDGRILVLKDSSIKLAVDHILHVSYQKTLADRLQNSFCLIFWIPGRSLSVNREVREIIRKSAGHIANLMPNMPKQVRKGPFIMEIARKDSARYRMLLWALGVEQLPEQPEAFLLYGRGRMMGGRLVYKDIKNNRLYDLMSMIGADCECGLDRKWMLGHQIPLDWPLKVRQHLVKEIGFDVDNPMVLAEMSRILNQDSYRSDSVAISFAPVEIDISQTFEPDGATKVTGQGITSSRDPVHSEVLIFIFLITGMVLIFGGWLYFKRKND
ncbi:MAG: hypothetical protein J7L89_08870 [Bacteroidales bacterium]|nr:hypothetical protein [Bacteroidales bacterium]